jgi:hypothetical protein
MTLGQELIIGPFHLYVVRILIAVGLIRALARGEQLIGGINTLDWLMLAWAVWTLASGMFHKDVPVALINRLGLVYNTCGIYFLLRVFIQSFEDITRLCRITAILLLPIAAEMLFEKAIGRNLFSVLGAVGEISAIREGSIRAQGPFSHPILAGTVGAVNLPLMISLWRPHRKFAIIGTSACLAMVVASASSGPILSALLGVAALFFWRFRSYTRHVRWIAVLGYLALEIVMKAPPYYLLARIDLAGGSTGWDRARLIESSLEHLNEWWFAGTDYTRHWMPTGVVWSPDHADIVNQYLDFGVKGGLPSMLLFLATLCVGFSFVGRALHQAGRLNPEKQFTLWVLGASLFSHAFMCISVSFFDQSFVFLYMILAAIGSAHSFHGYPSVNWVGHKPGVNKRSRFSQILSRHSWSLRRYRVKRGQVTHPQSGLRDRF